MKPEGPDNSGLVILKFIVFCTICGSVGLFVASLVSPFFKVSASMISGIMVFYVIGAVLTGHSARLMSAEVQFSSREKFVAQSTEALVKAQFHPISDVGDTVTFGLGFPMNAIYSAVSISFNGGTARIIASRCHLKSVLAAMEKLS